jgi:acetylornithine deacetylase/succinyl-diaminopimelate desuccinylase family protein
LTESASPLTTSETRLLDHIAGSTDALVALLQELIRFRTPNPPGGNEAQAQEFMAATLADLGMTVDIFDALPGRPNVVGRLEGRGGGRSILFNGHIDVAELQAPDAWSHDPFAGVRRGSRIYGLGASDMKSALTGAIVAIRSLRECGYELAGDVLYESVIGEEAGEPGTRACVERGVRADFAIVGESSKSDDVFVTGVGVFNFSVTLSDALSHHLIQRNELLLQNTEFEGHNCIQKMAEVIIPALLSLEQAWLETKTHPLLPRGYAMLNIFEIEGGGNTFILPRECKLHATAVYLPNDSAELVRGEINEIINAASERDEWLKDHPPVISWQPERHNIQFLPIDTSRTDVGARLLAQCLGQVRRRPVTLAGRAAIMDGGWLEAAGIPTVVFGPGDRRVIHRPDEYVEISDVVTFAQTLALFIARWSGG